MLIQFALFRLIFFFCFFFFFLFILWLLIWGQSIIEDPLYFFHFLLLLMSLLLIFRFGSILTPGNLKYHNNASVHMTSFFVIQQQKKKNFAIQRLTNILLQILSAHCIKYSCKITDPAKMHFCSNLYHNLPSLSWTF